MSAFKKEEFIPGANHDLPAVGQQIANHFRQLGYAVEVEPSIVGVTQVSLHKPSVFRAVMGLKTALKINLEPVNGGTFIRAEIGMWGHQIAPTAIMFLVAWPVLVTQIWGLVQQSKLDDEAVLVAKEAMLRIAGSPMQGTTIESSAKSCIQCGHILPENGKFCPGCGTPLSA